MFHRVQIINDGSIRTKVRLDNKPIKCTGYTIYQSVGEIPRIELEMLGNPEMTFKQAKIEVSDLDNLIEIMDADMFNEFCDRWKEKHD